MTTDLPYRLNVGAALFNHSGEVFVGRRTGLPAQETQVWQMPQGGIDEGENPREAVLRELEEEIGTRNATILAEHDEWLSYDLPPHVIGRVFGGRYRGQSQRWFALRFTGQDTDIRLDAHPHPEFVAWRWAPLTALATLAVDFKQPIYQAVALAFAEFAHPTPK